MLDIFGYDVLYNYITIYKHSNGKMTALNFRGNGQRSFGEMGQDVTGGGE